MTIFLDVYPTHTHVAHATDEEHLFIRRLLRYEDKTKLFYRQGGELKRNEDVVQYLYDMRSNTFPGGLTRYVAIEARRRGLGVQFTDKRPAKPAMTDVDISWLYPYQRKTVELAYKASRGIVQLPTGSGKTECFLALCLSIPIRWLVLTPDTDLLDNAFQRWTKRTGGAEQAGRVGAGHWDVRRVTVATMQTIMSRIRNPDPRMPDLLKNTEGLIIDEVHGCGSPGGYKTAMAFSNAYYRLGFSATALDRPDGRNLLVQAVTGSVIHKISSQELKDDGYIVMPKITMHECYQQGEYADFGEAYKALVVRSGERNDLLADIMTSSSMSPRPVLCFVKHIDHARRLCKRLDERGIPSLFASGKMKRAERDAAINALSDGTIDVLVATIFKQGVDIPAVRTVVNGAAGESAIDTLQKVGRGTRLDEGKTHFRVHDIFDRDLGSDSSARWLESHARSRQRSYTRAGYDVARGGLQQALAL